MKKISIIIATYNAEKTLQRCFDSIRNQKNEKVELIVIDGNSNDNTLSIIESNADIVDYYVSESDKGIYDAWNKGVKVSTGEWIEFLGADDNLLPDSLPFYLDYLEKNDDLIKYDIIVGRCWLVDNNGQRLKKYGDPYNWNVFKKFMKLSHGSSLQNRKLFEELGMFSLDFKICADYEFLLRKKLKAKFVNREILEMQIGGASDTIQGLIDSFRVKQARKASPCFINLYYLVKGIFGFYFRKFFVYSRI